MERKKTEATTSVMDIDLIERDHRGSPSTRTQHRRLQNVTRRVSIDQVQHVDGDLRRRDRDRDRNQDKADRQNENQFLETHIFASYTLF